MKSRQDMAQSNPNPFSLKEERDYAQWRTTKLEARKRLTSESRFELVAGQQTDESLISRMKNTCQASNSIFFGFKDVPEDPTEPLLALGQQLGLNRLDHNLCSEQSGVSQLTVKETSTDKQYIPYTNRPLSWHTDGYYNTPENQIRAWLLYCHQDAAEGGENEILDHELLYIGLRDQDPEHIHALMQPDALTIPANKEGGREIRADQTGPVFSIDASGYLHMRYSARTRNIIWRQDAATQAAVRAITQLLTGENNQIIRYRLQPGEGILSNNILHRREGFRDDPEHGKKRIFYRARYLDRISH